MLSKMFSLAETWDLVPQGRNPCRAVRHYREQSRERFLTPDEYRDVGAALREVEADGSMWPPAIAALRLLMLTGCRKGEILTLRWDDVDRTAGELRLRDGKVGPRMVPLTTPVQKVLDGIERIEGNPWVIRSRKPDACLPDLTYYWNRIQARAGLENVRIHNLHDIGSAINSDDVSSLKNNMLYESWLSRDLSFHHFHHPDNTAAHLLEKTRQDTIAAHLLTESDACELSSRPIAFAAGT